MNTPNASELATCPFCGGPAILEQVEREKPFADYRWTVGCRVEECIGYQSLTTYPRRKDATEAWNKRVLTAANGEPVAWRYRYRLVATAKWSKWDFIGEQDNEKLERMLRDGLTTPDLCEVQSLCLAPTPATAGTVDKWKEAVIDCCVLNHIGWHEDDPQKTLGDLINYEIQLNLDPCVSDSAQALIDRGRKEATAGASQGQAVALDGESLTFKNPAPFASAPIVGGESRTFKAKFASPPNAGTDAARLRCKGCGKPLLLENLLVEDGCPCNTPRGINFEPKPCDVCGHRECVRPGHRIADVVGIDPYRMAEWSEHWLKEGEHPLERIRRERRDSNYLSGKVVELTKRVAELEAAARDVTPSDQARDAERYNWLTERTRAELLELIDRPLKENRWLDDIIDDAIAAERGEEEK